MTEVEIHDVSLPAKLSDQLWGCSVEVPLIGSGDAGFWIHVAGYVSGRWRPAAAVEFTEADTVVRVAAVRIARPDVANSRPGEREVEFCGFYALVDARKLSPEFDLRVEAVLDNGNRVPMGSIRGIHQYHLAEAEKPARETSPPAGPPSAAEGDGEPPVPSIKDDLGGLLLETLSDGESHLLDDEPSLADVETSLLDGIALAGQTVLDLGSGVGERARAARARGAASVDGFEPDSQLVALARLLSAYHRTTRVFFHQHDDVLQGAGGEEYDVVLALGGFDVARDRLDAIASLTRGVFVTELPASDPERAAALESVRARFPFNELLELSTEQGSRLFLVGTASEPNVTHATVE